MEIGVREAKSGFSKLIKAALKGEEVVITNHGRALVRVVAEVPSQADRSRAFGSLKHLLADLPADWDSAEHQNELSRRFEHVQELMEKGLYRDGTSNTQD